MDLSNVILRLVVTDLPTSTLWNQRLLGVDPMEPDDGASVFVLTPTAVLHLVEEDELTSTAPGCGLTLRVPDLAGALAEVDGLGIPRTEVVTLGENAGMFTLQDPDGREVAVLQIAA